MPFRIVILILSCLSLHASAVAKDAWVTSDDYADFQIVLGDSDVEADYWAARRFGLHWARLTGHEIPITRYPDPKKVNVWIGQVDNPFVSTNDLEGLGTDGYIARTFSIEGRRERKQGRMLPLGKHLIIVGGGPRGTLFGEFDFFKRLVGVRVFVPGSVHWPESPESLPRIDYRWIPEIEYRDISYRTFVHGNPFTSASFLNLSMKNTRCRVVTHECSDAVPEN